MPCSEMTKDMDNLVSFGYGWLGIAVNVAFFINILSFVRCFNGHSGWDRGFLRLDRFSWKFPLYRLLYSFPFLGDRPFASTF